MWSPNPSHPGSFQDPGPQPLELKEVFALFQTQYNRSYLNPAGIMGPVYLQSNPISPT